MTVTIKKEELETIKGEQKDLGNIGIFVDFDNIYHSLRDFGVAFEDLQYNLFDFLWEIYNKDNVRVLKAYADYDQLNIKLRDLQTKRVQIKQVYGNGQGEKHRKNASDIELSIDAIESAYSTNNIIDTYVFVTADSDMIPIMSRMAYKGKKVHLYYLGTNTSQYQNITDYAHKSLDLTKVFEFDLQRANPHYWEETIKNHIKIWYTDRRNQTKLYGGNWLNDDLKEKFKMSFKLASAVIKHLEDEGIIVKYATGGIDGYVVQEDLETIKSRFNSQPQTTR
jgi:uncharacterized LabA/DUF88 family protein